MPERLRYASWDDVPPGLQTANDLRFAGLEPRGEAVGVVVVGEREVELFASADATPRARERLSTEGERVPVGAAGSTGGRASRRATVALPGGSELITRVRRIDADPTTLRSEARAYLGELLASDFLVLDTETTGLGYQAEIIELALVAPDGSLLFDSLVRPRGGVVPAVVSRVHGITTRDLVDAPTFADLYATLLDLAAGRRIVAWNAAFDERMVRQSARVWSLPQRWRGFECAMQTHAFCCGVRSGRTKLERAAAALGVLPASGQRHRSADDARLTLGVLRATLAQRL
jgi:DNA polymerase III subunit epsilon